MVTSTKVQHYSTNMMGQTFIKRSFSWDVRFAKYIFCSKIHDSSKPFSLNSPDVLHAFDRNQDLIDWPSLSVRWPQESLVVTEGDLNGWTFVFFFGTLEMGMLNFTSKRYGQNLSISSRVSYVRCR